MPLYTMELDTLKKELIELRKYNSFYGYEGKVLPVDEYCTKKYHIPTKISGYLKKFVHEQEKDILSFSKNILTDQKVITPNNMMRAYSTFSNVDFELENTDHHFVHEDASDNYFNAEPLDLYFDKIVFKSYHTMTPSREVMAESSSVLTDIDKIFQYELERLKKLKSSIYTVSLQQKVSKVYSKIKVGKINEAAVLISRFYNDNKQELIFGYLYFEVLYAKAALGNQKSLAKAREVANNVCFLTDKSDEETLSYYRYLYVCREYSYDPERSLQLFKEFVLIDPERYTSKNILTKRDGFYLKCLILFLRHDIKQWTAYDIETAKAITYKATAGTVFYIAFVRDELLKHITHVRFDKFVQIEINLYDNQQSHAKLIGKIKELYNTNGLPKNAADKFHTAGQKYLKSFFKAVKVPNYFEFLVNTSLSGIQFYENTANDQKLISLGLSCCSLWRAWIGKITAETSLQRSDMIPIEQVAKESELLSKYATVAKDFYEYEQQIYKLELYDKVKELLPNITQKGIVSVILGENKYSVFDYGLSWGGIKDYYDKLRLMAKPECSMASDLIMKKAKKGLFWNLEEIQMLLEATNLIIDNNRLGLKARLDALLMSNDPEAQKNSEYMSLSEHLELYWWVYILLVSLLIMLFNLIF